MRVWFTFIVIPPVRNLADPSLFGDLLQHYAFTRVEMFVIVNINSVHTEQCHEASISFPSLPEHVVVQQSTDVRDTRPTAQLACVSVVKSLRLQTGVQHARMFELVVPDLQQVLRLLQ